MSDTKSSFFSDNQAVYEDTNPPGPVDGPNPSSNTGAPSSFFKSTGSSPPIVLLDGIEAFDPIPHNFLTGVNNVSGWLYVQPSFTDIAGVIAALQLPSPTLTTLGGVKALDAVAHKFLTSIGTDGAPTQAQPSASDLSDGVTGTGAVVLADSPALTSPTGIVKSDVGLSNVDNTADADKPISTAQQTALDLKAPLASPTFTGTVSGITKAMVGLGSVDNTSDATKNAAVATLTNKTLTSPVVNSPTGIVKGDVGLGNVDNTSDANKPVSTAQQTALNLKANLASPTFTGTVSGITKAMVGLGNVDNTADASKAFAASQITSGTLADGRLPARLQTNGTSAFIDLNTLTDSGLFFGNSANGTTNGPSALNGSFYNLVSYGTNTAYMVQTARVFGGTDTYTRVQAAGTWGSWTKDVSNADLALKVDIASPTLRPSSSATPANNGDLVIQATSNTSLTFKYKGSDGTVRSASLTLS